jgi:hypothetical protein
MLVTYGRWEGSMNSITEQEFEAAVYLTFHTAFEMIIGDAMEQAKAERIALDRDIRVQYPGVLHETAEQFDQSLVAFMLQERRTAFNLGCDVANVTACASVVSWPDELLIQHVAHGVRRGLMKAADSLQNTTWKMYAFAKLAGIEVKGIADLALFYLADSEELGRELNKPSISGRNEL